MDERVVWRVRTPHVCARAWMIGHNVLSQQGLLGGFGFGLRGGALWWVLIVAARVAIVVAKHDVGDLLAPLLERSRVV